MRWGFKTEANDIAREVRHGLNLKAVDPLNPWRLAEYLAIVVFPLKLLTGDASKAVRFFTRVDRNSFSAVTVFCGSARVIVHNDAHSPGRQSSDIAHELAHALLLHPPLPALDHRGCRNWDKELEEEANWLAGALLISEEAALMIARSGMSLQDAATRYGVTPYMVRFRLNVLGARKRVYLARRKHARA